MSKLNLLRMFWDSVHPLQKPTFDSPTPGCCFIVVYAVSFVEMSRAGTIAQPYGTLFFERRTNILGSWLVDVECISKIGAYRSIRL